MRSLSLWSRAEMVLDKQNENSDKCNKEKGQSTMKVSNVGGSGKAWLKK